jgi:hypothetical protein
MEHYARPGLGANIAPKMLTTRSKVVFQLVQLGRIAFLKLAVREALLLCVLVTSLNQVLRDIDPPLRVSPLVRPSFRRRIRDPKP